MRDELRERPVRVAKVAARQAHGRLHLRRAQVHLELDRETAFALVWMTERACYQRLVQGGSVEDDAFLQSLVGIWRRAVYGRLDD